jgi:hypothetical protein
MRQFDAERASENGDDDAVEKQQDRCGNAHGNDDADHQEDANSNDCDGIPVGHRATMQAFARCRQGRPVRASFADIIIKQPMQRAPGF